jgi:hypothetical protein
MKIETINGIRVATPESGMLLCNEEQKVICAKVYLGVNSDETLWKEITETEKAELEAMWSEEATPETPVDEEATESDYINALKELGVSFDE